MSADRRQDFSLDDGIVYLNCANLGPMPRVAVEATRRALHLKTNPHLIDDRSFYAVPDDFRRAVAQLVGAAPSDIAVTDSTTFGIMLVVNGLDWQAGDQVAITARNFPANRFPWQWLERRGVEVVEVPDDPEVPEVERFAAVLTPRTRVVSLEWVSYRTGPRRDLAGVGALCRERGVLFVVDGTQGVGGLHFDLAATPCDLLVCSSYKWLLGPVGVGFAYVPPATAERLVPYNVNWFRVAGAEDFSRLAECELELVPGAGLNRGRNFELYRNRYRALVRPMVKLMVDQQKKSNVLSDAAHALCPAAFAEEEDEEDTKFAAIATQCGEKEALQARALIAAEAAAFLEPLVNLRASLTTKGFDRFGELVANQPQLHVSLTATEREPLVGANTTSGKLTYEWARVNLAHAMSDECHRRLEQGGDPEPEEDKEDPFVAACARDYTSYVTAKAAEIAEGDRFSFTLEYESVESLLVPLSTLLPDADVEDFRSPSSKTRIAKLGWSRNFGGLQGQPTRFDLVAGYEDVTDDPARRDRLVATATMNLKFGQMDVPFGIVYANHGKYLGEVDEQLSAHLGLKFDLKALTPAP